MLQRPDSNRSRLERRIPRARGWNVETEEAEESGNQSERLLGLQVENEINLLLLMLVEALNPNSWFSPVVVLPQPNPSSSPHSRILKSSTSSPQTHLQPLPATEFLFFQSLHSHSPLSPLRSPRVPARRRLHCVKSCAACKPSAPRSWVSTVSMTPLSPDTLLSKSTPENLWSERASERFCGRRRTFQCQ